MIYQKIAAGVDMPMLGFGTFLNVGSNCEQSVAEAIYAGYRLIDTAEAYGNEEQVGNGIRQSGIDRRDLFLVTKVMYLARGKSTFWHVDFRHFGSVTDFGGCRCWR